MLSKREAAETIIKNNGCSPFDPSCGDCPWNTDGSLCGAWKTGKVVERAAQWLKDNPEEKPTGIDGAFEDKSDEGFEAFKKINEQKADKTKSTIAEWRKRGEDEPTWTCPKCNATMHYLENQENICVCCGRLLDENCKEEYDETIHNKFHSIYASHEAMLLEKNKRYGDSALKPAKVFASHLDDIDSILIRLDDKISRIRNSDEIRKNDVSDLMGYCVLLCKAKGWMGFMDQVD